jgi:hypothetical protein
MSDEGQLYDPAQRAEEKARAREQDELDLASGAKTRPQLRRENGLFAFRNAVVLWDQAKRFY